MKDSNYSTVIVVDNKSLTQAIKLIDGAEELFKSEEKVVIKVGIYNPQTQMCTTVSTLNAIINAFERSTDIYITE